MKNTNNEIKELTDFLDKYDVEYVAKFSTAIDFLDPHDIEYRIEKEKEHVVADRVDIDHKGITQLPDSIGRLKCRQLYLNGNKLTSLPESFGNLTCECLSLKNNKLTSLPKNFGNLKCDYLSLEGNKLTSLPESFENLTCKWLDMSYSPLTAESENLLEKLESNGVGVISSYIKYLQRRTK